MRIWFPLAILLSVGWLLLVAALVSRGGDGAGASKPLAGDAATLLRQSQAAMLELDSFQSEMTMQWEGRDITYRLVWQSPDSVHVLSPNIVAESSSDNPEVVITDYGFAEAMAVADRIYFRQCATGAEDCEPWLEGLRDNTYVPGIGGEALNPFWTIELLGMMSDAQIVGQEDVEGVACTRVRGRANIMRAMIEAWRRAEEIRGPLYWGEECTATPVEAGGETEEECHSLSLDEYMAANEDSLLQQDESPLSVEVWVGRDDNLLRAIEFPVLPGVEPAPGSYTFSRFDEVTVEPPR